MKVTKPKTRLSEEARDATVIAQADCDACWEEPVRVTRDRKSVEIPSTLLQRAAFLAALHGAKDVQAWIAGILRERVELEEEAYLDARKELAQGQGLTVS